MSTTTSSEDATKEKLGRAIGRMASGVYIVTIYGEDGKDGMLTTWLVQSAFEPPMLSLAVKKGRPLLDHLKKGSTFSVNVLSKKNMDVFKNFAKPHTEGMDRFEGLSIDAAVPSGPVFKDCVAYMSCKMHDKVEAGDHYVVVAEITEGALLAGDEEPMTHFRKSGFQY
jgi:flavin reductase (DIM6/NTAB) family NADH-FMN oxidoreductase RutF